MADPYGHTDAEFNASSRMVQAKVEICFPSATVTVDHTDYIISFDLLEEMCADGSTIFGSLSSNVFNLTLENFDRRFSPKNVDGPYYGEIALGLELKLYMRLVAKTEKTWLSLGSYFVTDWKAPLVGGLAYITAEDSMSSIMRKGTELIEIKEYEYYAEFMADIDEWYDIGFQMVDHEAPLLFPIVDKDSDLGTVIHEATTAALSFCYCNRSIYPTVTFLIEDRVLRATLTDANQIVNPTAEQSIKAMYDGVKVVYYSANKHPNELVLSKLEYEVEPGYQEPATIVFDKGPVKDLTTVVLQTSEENPHVLSFLWTPWTIDLSTQNDSVDPVVSNLQVYGTTIEYTKQELFANEEAENQLVFDNRFLQDADTAEILLYLLDMYCSADILYLEVEIRGNLLLELNDMVMIQSTAAKLEFVGLIVRIRTTYAGSFKQTLTLLNMM